MRTFEEIKDEVAKDNGFVSWDNLTFIHSGFIKVVQPFNDEATKRFAIEVSKEALKNASERARLIAKEYDCDCGSTHLDWNIDKQSILNESNIPKL